MSSTPSCRESGVICLVMIWSGLLIYWANDVYELRVGGVTLFHFFPDWFYRALDLEHSLATARGS